MGSPGYGPILCWWFEVKKARVVKKSWRNLAKKQESPTWWKSEKVGEKARKLAGKKYIVPWMLTASLKRSGDVKYCDYTFSEPFLS